VLENFFDKAHSHSFHRGSSVPTKNPLVTRQRNHRRSNGRGLTPRTTPMPRARRAQAAPRLPSAVRPSSSRTATADRAAHALRQSTEERRSTSSIPRGPTTASSAHNDPADKGHTWLFVGIGADARSARPRRLDPASSDQQGIRKKVRETSLILDVGAEGPPRPVSVESDRLGLAARQLYERWRDASAEATQAGRGVTPAKRDGTHKQPGVLAGAEPCELRRM